MKKIFLLASMGFIASTTFAQKAKNAPKVNKTLESKMPIEDPARRIAAEQARMISPMHNNLHQWAGHWREEYKIWNNPKDEPATVRLERDSRIEAEGKFLNSSTMGMMNNMPYEGHGIIGFDNVKQVFVKTWYDNLSTSILVLEGTINEKEKTIEYRGTTMNPMTKTPVNIRQVQDFSNPETQTLTVYMQGDDGNEIKSMEIKSVR